MASPFIGERNPGVMTKIAGNRSDQKIETGEALPPLFQTEKPSSISVLISSSDRYTGNDASFRVNLNYRVMRPRYLTLKKCIVPKIPNITPLNNSIRIKHAGGTTAFFTLTPGIYNTTTFANALTTAINAAFVAAAIVDTVTTTYDPIARAFTVTSVGGLNFFFDATCTFITRGLFMHALPGTDIAAAVSVSAISGGIAGMVYSRYLTVSSDALTQYSYSSSILSRLNQPNDIIGIIDVATIYDPADFDVSIPYAGVYKSLNIDAPQLSLLCSQRSMNEDIDITISDEYGTTLDQSLALGGTYGANTLGLVLIFDLVF